MEWKICVYSKVKDKVNEGEVLSSLGIFYYKVNRFVEVKSCYEWYFNLVKVI